MLLKRAEQQPGRNAPTTRMPSPAPRGHVLALQRTAGNQAVTGLLHGTGISGARRQAFGARAGALGLGPDQIEQLWQAGGASGPGGFAPVVERTAELFSAARRASASGIPSFYVEMKIDKLSELNATLGHSRADELIASARSAALERLVSAVGPAQPLAGRAGTFGFLVTGGNDTTISESHLGSAAGSAAAAVGRQLGLSVTAAVMDVDDAATSAVIADLAREESATAASNGTRSLGDRDSARFTSTGTDRRRNFSSLAEGFGLDADAASELYGMLLGGRPDALTGFEGDADRVATVRKAAAQRNAAVYVEVDVRNLGGLNRSLGRAKADSVFAKMAATAERELRSCSDVGDAWPFRHGGDEFSFVIVARRPGVSAGQLEFAAGAALTRATKAIGEATSELSGIAHTKPLGRAGTGIVWGTSVIGPGADPAAVFSAADRKVERKKTAGGAVVGA